ncbi:MAG: hypothetical protein XD60_1746 [Acetothermia bacterium 64_32]|nr:MAG: hypothetical protein XD60_1746 [Acetothermia bacterium 64_32]
MRALRDQEVDRPQVEARRRVEPSGTNSPIGLRSRRSIHFSGPVASELVSDG